MPLDIWFGNWDSPGSKLMLSFEEEAYYWFIEPLIAQSCEQGGKWFDLYDGAEFKPDELHHIEQIIDRAIELVESKPQTWDVKVGMQDKPEQRELCTKIEKQPFLDFLSAWKRIVDKCQKKRQSMFLYGD